MYRPKRDNRVAFSASEEIRPTLTARSTTRNAAFTSEEYTLRESNGQRRTVLSAVDEPDLIPLLEKGGYIIFSDFYASHYPQSRMSAITRYYQRHTGRQEHLEEARIPEDPDYAESLIKEVYNLERPVFRRLSSGLAYGRSACYK